MKIGQLLPRYLSSAPFNYHCRVYYSGVDGLAGEQCTHVRASRGYCDPDVRPGDTARR